MMPTSSQGQSEFSPHEQMPRVEHGSEATAQSSVLPKYCRQCGAAWQATWTTCPHCDKAASSASFSTVNAHQLRKPVVHSIALCLALLITTLIGLFSVADEASVWIRVAFIDTVIVVLWAAIAWRWTWSSLRSASTLHWYGVALLLSVGTLASAEFAISGLAQLGFEELLVVQPFTDSGYGLGMVFLVVCIQPAVIEELAFRGIIFSGLRQLLSGSEVIIISSLLFVILHISIVSIPHLLLIGLALGYLRERSGSLYPCIVLHFTHNLMCVVDEYLSGKDM